MPERWDDYLYECGMCGEFFENWADARDCERYCRTYTDPENPDADPGD